MLERLLAGVVVIGALLWVASTFATPDVPPPFEDGAAIAPPVDRPVDVPDVPTDPAEDDAGEGGDDGDDDGDDREERRGKGKKRDPDG